MDEAEDENCECALRCRQLAMRTYELADEAEHPQVIAHYLKIAAKLTACAEKADRGEVYDWEQNGD